MIVLSRAEARRLAVAAQGLATPPVKAASKHDVLDVVRRLGCVQIDTISVVARSQYLVLWSRLGCYDPDWLDELLYPDRAVFEYWAHAASIIPIELFPYFRRRMEFQATRSWASRDNWAEENAALLEQVREAVRNHGPISSSHFSREDPGQPVSPWSWWGGKPTNRALDLLWSVGEFGIDRRVNFQRYYDLSERLYPNWHDTELVEIEREQHALGLAALRAMGVTLPRWLNDYFRTRWGVRGEDTSGPDAVLERLVESGDAFRVEVEGLGTGYVAERNRRLLDDVRSGQEANHVTFLSPFDNLIWDRQRTEELFSFEYRIECYTPAAKRRYGYFTLPILYRGELIGRLDPKVDRRARHLVIRAVHPEPGDTFDAPVVAALGTTLRDFARFNGADTITIESGPPDVVRALRSEISDHVRPAAHPSGSGS